MKIFFARHGEYENPSDLAPFRSPGFTLTKHGEEQIAQTATHLKDLKIRAIYTSPIQRCLQTAGIIGKELKLYPNQKEALIEVDSPLALSPKSSLSDDFYDFPLHIAGDGETREQVLARMKDFVGTLKLLSKNSVFLIVSHGDPIMLYLRDILKKDLRYIPMGGLVMVDYAQTPIPKYTEII